MANRFAEADFAVVYAQIKSALRVGTDPRFKNDRRTLSALIGQRHEHTGCAFLAYGVDFFHDACLPHKE
jgi:hypothetical protein